MLRRLFLLAFVFVATTATFCSLACVLAIVVCLGGSWFVACAWSVATTAIVASFPAVVASRFELDDETLEDDLRRLATIVDLDAFASSRHDVEDAGGTTPRRRSGIIDSSLVSWVPTPCTPVSRRRRETPFNPPLTSEVTGGFEGGTPLHRCIAS